MLQPGAAAPAFRLPSTSGQTVALEDFRGRKVVLYFYPKDETPGCTKEACDFRDSYAPLAAAGAVVLGVSKDPLDLHHKFRAHHNLPFDLLTDEDNAVAQSYGAYGERSMYGTKVMGTIRSTVLIGEDGRVLQVWSPVRVEGHVAEVLAAVAGAPAGSAPDTVPAPAPAAPIAPAAAARPAKPARKTARKTAAKPAAAGTKPAPKAKAAGKPTKKAAGKAAAKKAVKPAKKKAAKKAAAGSGKARAKAARKPVKKAARKGAKKSRARR